MAVDAAKLQAYALDEYLDAWERDGVLIPETKRAFPAFEEEAAPHPDALDRLTAGPQHAFLRTMDAIMADRWRDAIGGMKATPAEDALYKAPDIGLLNEFACRIFRKNAPKFERVRFQDHVLLQRSTGNFQNYVELKLTTEDATTNDAIFEVLIREEDGNWEAPVNVTLDHDGIKKLYVLKAIIGPRDIGKLLTIEIRRDKDSVGDTLDNHVGLIAARLV